ncbi:hypothetical protein [Dethiosulfatarculus sandiegensis]|uniref:Uncharacterized protein n=1 Tax=Dethiosulfatarculus sandiegensis TaxID=1429043 RepID=A0A0D2J729_9BACT|nr:hypothetical protein [Dethiosulfatarculus sandiegensis]KIX13979.1 hypothetical protein X474_12825 [Dethiosulfatarculus sandiegensis]
MTTAQARMEWGFSYVSNFDTAYNSPLHWLFTEKPNGEKPGFKNYFYPYAGTVFLLFVLPLLVALGTLPTLTEKSPTLLVPYLCDHNMNFGTLITLPLAMTLLLIHRDYLPYALKELITRNALETTDDTRRFFEKWTTWFKKINLYGYIAAIILAGLVAYLHFKTVTSTQAKAGWQTDAMGVMNTSGWVFILWNIPAMMVISVMYCVRSAATIFMLYGLVRVTKVNIDPFNYDRSGGLREIASLGLWNQYLLAAVIINAIILFHVTKVFGQVDNINLLIGAMLAAALVLGPLVFLGPLLPFRKAMKKTKKHTVKQVNRRLIGVYKIIKEGLDQDAPINDFLAELEHLKKLEHTVRHIPVWPFDTVTMKKFGLAYMLPLIVQLSPKVLTFLGVFLAPYTAQLFGF